MTAKLSVRALGAALLLFVMSLLFSCDGGSETQPDLNGKRPSITDLSTHSANIGDSLDVKGLNFGTSQTGGQVQLNGVDFTINQWTETQITVTVTAGMASGIVVVTAGGLPSQSGPEAQLFIPAAPAGRPLISAVTPDFGYPLDEILITGSGFGPAGAGNVFFPAQSMAVSQDAGVVAAEIVTLDVDGTAIPQWGSTSIKVLIPEQSQFGKINIYVEVNGQRSNEMPLTVYPPTSTGAPYIEDVAPGNGAAGTPIEIFGGNFGHSQGGSRLMIGNFPLTVASWTDTLINAAVPKGAITADIFLTKPGYPVAQWGPFIVANSPVITGVSPSIVDIGDTFVVYGRDFGYEQGTGTLRIGGAAQSVDAWSNNEIRIFSLGSLPGGGELLVKVTSDNDLESNEWPIYFEPPLEVRTSVSPSAGQRNSESGDPGTPFTFAVSVKGGSGNYQYYLIPDADNPGVEAPVNTTGTIIYTYPFDTAANDEEYIDTKIRVVDTTNALSLTVDGPTLLIVNYGVPVITGMAVESFNRGTGVDAPQEWCYIPADDSYYDFSFVSGQPRITSSKGDILSGGNPLPAYTRNLKNFMVTGNDPRPYGYRYAGTAGSALTVQGLNFGDTEGQVYLNANDLTDSVLVTNFSDWSNTAITFELPPENKDLSGVVRVIPSGDDYEANSIQPLICSPYVVELLPTTAVNYPVGSVVLSGLDFQPGVLAGMTGTKTYAIWVINATYPDPYGTGTPTDTVLLTTPIEPAELVATNMTLSMNDIDIDHNGTVPVEVFNSTKDQSQVVEATPVDGSWYFYLWTGVLNEGTNQQVATSGIFSELYTVTVGSQNPGEDPTAVLQANPTTGEAPLIVDFDASGSFDDDGTIDKYEFDFGEGAGWEDFGTTATAQHTYNADGTYQARVQVTDNDGRTDDDTVTITVGGGGGGGDVNITITINFNGWATNHMTTRVAIYDHMPTGVTDIDWIGREPGDPNPFGRQDTARPVDGVGETLAWEGIVDGQYWYSLYRTSTQWPMGGPEEYAVFGPFTVAEDVHNFSHTGDQFENPPPPS